MREKDLQPVNNKKRNIYYITRDGLMAKEKILATDILGPRIRRLCMPKFLHPMKTLPEFYPDLKYREYVFKEQKNETDFYYQEE